MVNLHIKFEVSVSTYYEDIKGDTKCRKWCGFVYVVRGHARSLEEHHSIERIGLTSSY